MMITQKIYKDIYSIENEHYFKNDDREFDLRIYDWEDI